MISDFFCSFIFQNAIFLLDDCYLVLVFTYCDRLRTVQDFRQIHTVLFCLFFFFVDVKPYISGRLNQL